MVICILEETRRSLFWLPDVNIKYGAIVHRNSLQVFTKGIHSKKVQIIN